jgi:hypothetical protein
MNEWTTWFTNYIAQGMALTGKQNKRWKQWKLNEEGFELAS